MSTKQRPHVKGLCLAAGFATRLKPISETMAKARVPIFGIPSLHFMLARLEGFGVVDVAVNSHHLANQVKELVEQYRGKSKLRYSFEKEILGTGGAFIPLKDWIGESHILMANPDIVTNLDIPALINTHFAQNNFVTLAVIPNAPAGKTCSVHQNADQLVCHIGKNPSGVQSSASTYGIGFFMVSPKIMEFLPSEGFANFTDAVNAAIAAGKRVGVMSHAGYFRDIGDSVEDLYGIHADLMRDKQRLLKELNIESIAATYSSPLQIDPNRNTVVSKNSRIDITAVLEDGCFVFNSSVAAHCTLSRCLAFDASINSSTKDRVRAGDFALKI